MRQAGKSLTLRPPLLHVLKIRNHGVAAKVSLVAACLQTSCGVTVPTSSSVLSTCTSASASLTRLHQVDFDALHSTGMRRANRAEGFGFQAAVLSTIDANDKTNLTGRVGFQRLRVTAQSQEDRRLGFSCTLKKFWHPLGLAMGYTGHGSSKQGSLCGLE